MAEEGDTKQRFSRRDEADWQKLLRDLRALQEQVDALQKRADDAGI